MDVLRRTRWSCKFRSPCSAYRVLIQCHSGLGTGISASAFIQHGLSTTVVELDPAVVDAAKTYFGFKPTDPKKVHTTDARSFVSSQLRQAGKPKTPSETFDIVIHDVFSGGGVPAHLFTVAFWQDLAKIMKPDGVVAVVCNLIC